MGLKYMPIGIKLKDRRCLVVGGGKVAVRKIETLLEYDTEITVVAPKADRKIEYFAERGQLTLKKRAYQSPEALDYAAVISASNDNQVNQTVSADCRKTGIPVNVVDNPKLCDFIFPATFHRDCLTVAVSSDGQAPFLSGHLRVILEQMFEEKRWTTIVQLASVFRRRVQNMYPDNPERKLACYSRFLETDWKEVFKEVPEEELGDYIDRFLEFD